MHETAEDLAALQEVIDCSYADAGRHLLRIHTPERRLTAEQVAERLQGMSLIALATTTAGGRPLVGPVDGIFYRGAFHFGSSPDSFRFRHIRSRPHVSATHLPGEHLAITVHGRATVIEVEEQLRGVLRNIYGEQWLSDILDRGALYARIDADRMFTYSA